MKRFVYVYRTHLIWELERERVTWVPGQHKIYIYTFECTHSICVPPDLSLLIEFTHIHMSSFLCAHYMLKSKSKLISNSLDKLLLNGWCQSTKQLHTLRESNTVRGFFHVLSLYFVAFKITKNNIRLYFIAPASSYICDMIILDDSL